jgi:hypothetical protein
VKLPIVDRRQFLTALGLGGASLFLPSLGSRPRRAQAADGVPVRVLFYITPQGQVPNTWAMRPMGEDRDYTFDLIGLPESQWSRTLRPLFRHRAKIMPIDGLCNTTSLGEVARVQRGVGHDANAHHVCQAHLLTCDWAIQREGQTAIGGARSFDQVLGDLVGVPGRWGNRVYGDRHGHPYSFVAPGEAAPREQEPGAAFSDIMGIARPTPMGEPTREDLIDRSRSSTACESSSAPPWAA